MKRFLSILVGLSLLFGGCGTNREDHTPVCSELMVSPEVKQSLDEVGKALPFRLVFPCDERFTLTHVQMVVPPGVSGREQQEAHPDWRYVRMGFSVAGGAGFSVLQSNGNISLDGEKFSLAGRDAVFGEAEDSRQVWVDAGGIQFVLESGSLARPELEAIATELIRGSASTPPGS